MIPLKGLIGVIPKPNYNWLVSTMNLQVGFSMHHCSRMYAPIMILIFNPAKKGNLFCPLGYREPVNSRTCTLNPRP